MKTITRFKAVWLVLMVLVTCLPTVRAASQSPEVLSAEQVLNKTGKTIAEWGAEWWQWGFDNPDFLFDISGKFADLGNVGGPVFFAQGSGGAPVHASFYVPGGQYVLLPVATYLWTFFPPCANVECAREIVNDHFLDRIIEVSVQIDGEPVANISEHLVRVDEGHPLVFQVDAGPIQPDGYGGILDAVQGGCWIMLAPLPRGKHRVTCFARVPNLDPSTGAILDGYFDLNTKLNMLPAPKGR
jgi:hypothetical protein